MVVAGSALIAVAVLARKQITDRRLAAVAVLRPVEQNAGDQRAAEQELARLYNATKAEPNNKQKQSDLVDFYLKHNILNKAAIHLALIIKLDPNDLTAQLKLADVSLQAKAYSTAEIYYRRVAQRDPQNLPAMQGLASSLTQERRGYEALTVAENTLKIDPANTLSRLTYATSLVTYALQFPDPMAHADYLEKARAMLVELAKELPDNGEVFYQYGWALIGLQRREDAIAELERAVKLLPDDADAARTLANAYRSINRGDDALKVMQNVTSRSPNDPTSNDMLGQLLISSNQPGSIEKAVSAFKIAAASSPDDEGIQERLGEANEKVNDVKGARLAYEQAIKLNPNRSIAYDRLALVYTKLGENGLAKRAAATAEQIAAREQQLKTSQELSASHPDNVQMHLDVAGRLRALKRDSEARDEYFQVLKLDPENKRVPQEFLKVNSHK
jgi:tetratricopeptide (TPR) repeat protein